MSRISIAFFATAVLYALAGMVLGIVMGATEDFAMRPVHAHINLLGWAGLALMGAFYGLAGAGAPAKLAWTVFAVSNVGNVLSLSQVTQISQGKPPIVPVLVSGEILIVLGMLLFGASVLMVGRKASAA